MGSAITEQLDALLLGHRRPLDTELKVVLSRLANEVRQRVSRGSPDSYDFMAAVLRSISRVRGSAYADVRLSCLFECATFFLTNRFNREALECSKHLEALSKKTRDKTWLRKALMLQGIIYGMLGDCGESANRMSVALTIAREQSDALAEVAALVNLGSTLNYAGLHRDAIPCFRRAISITKKSAQVPPGFVASALCNLAQSQYALGEYQPGLTSIMESLDLSEEPADSFAAFNRAVREYTYVQLALELGKITSARAHAAECRKYAVQSATRKATFLADQTAGLCEIHGGDVAKGLETLKRAVENPDEQGSVDHVDALAALVRAYDHALQPERALDCMAILLRTMRKRREDGLDALRAMSSHAGAQDWTVAEDVDLRTLTVREANLRAQVAEREASDTQAEMLERLAVAADLKEEASGEHGYRVGMLAALLGAELSWERAACRALDMAARLHDIGKIAVPDRILLSSKELQEAERHFISTHTTIGAELLAKSNIPQLRMAEEIARHHHEWWNGEGYPSKLKGKRIPIHARIVAIADVFDALTHGRPFSAPWPIDKALDEIKARKGTQFDPELTDLFLDLIARLRSEHEDLDEYLGRAGRNSPFLQARNKIRMMLAEEREHEKAATVSGNETRH